MTPQDYRANASQCLRWAEQASFPDNREAFFDLADKWERAALRLERAATLCAPASGISDQASRRAIAS
jgi:hypothetical protein